MGDFYNISINDAYAAAMSGVPVRPGLAASFAAPYADLNSHDAFDHGEHAGHGKHKTPSHQRKLWLALSAIGVVAGAILLGKMGKAPRPTTTQASFWNPRTWGWARWNRATPRNGLGEAVGVHPSSPVHPAPPPDPHGPGFWQNTGTRIADTWNNVRTRLRI